MIRFIDLTGQIDPDYMERQFSFFDTTTDRFCLFSGSQYWEHTYDLVKDMRHSSCTDDYIKRFLGLIPAGFFEDQGEGAPVCDATENDS